MRLGPGARALHALAVVAASVTLAFVVLHLVPGDPLSLMIEHTGRSEAAKAALRAQYGLDQSVFVQYLRYLRTIASGDLGASLSNGQAVAGLVRDAMLNSVVLGTAALSLAMLIGVLVGSLEGWWPRARGTRAAGAVLTAMYAIPEFIFALLMIGVLAYRLSWFPVGGVSDPVLAFSGTAMERILDRAWHLALPALTLAVGVAAAIAKQQRRALLDLAQSSFVRTARAKGLSDVAVLSRHALKPSLPAVIAAFGVMMPALIGGAVVVELVFSWPGLGSLIIQGIAARDYPVVTGAILVVGVLVSVSAWLADLVTWLLDPRLRAAGESSLKGVYE